MGAQNYDVVIVGGGPVGLFLGLNLAKSGIQTVVLEAEADIVQSPRALAYFPIVLNEFEKLGVLDDILKAGYKNTEGLEFRTPYGGTDKVLAKIPPGRAPAGTIDYVVHLGQPKVASIIRKHALACSNFRLEYNTRFENLKEDKDGVVVEAKKKDGTSDFYKAQFVVGCDGANSSVRKAVKIPFEGYSWEDFRFLAINIKYDFGKYGYPGASHVIDPQDWAVIGRAGPAEENLWRIACGIDPKIPVDEIPHHVPAKLEKLLPGPRPLQYELVAVSPYWAHEKVAKTYRAGRVVLCGDAAHVNNPLTAMGLTTGLVDVAYLSRILPLAFTPKFRSSWPKLLDRYAILRRNDFTKNVQKFVLEGKMRIHSQDPKVDAQRKDFFNMLNKNPGFAMFVASTQVEKVPDDLFPSPLTSFMNSLAGVWKIMCLIPMIIFWKIKAETT